MTENININVNAGSNYGPESKWGRQSFFDGGLLSFIGWSAYYSVHAWYLLSVGVVYGLWLEN